MLFTQLLILKKLIRLLELKYEVVKGSGTVEGLSLNYSDLKNLEGILKLHQRQLKI